MDARGAPRGAKKSFKNIKVSIFMSFFQIKNLMKNSLFKNTIIDGTQCKISFLLVIALNIILLHTYYLVKKSVLIIKYLFHIQILLGFLVSEAC